jgi:thioredoxin-related protein
MRKITVIILTVLIAITRGIAEPATGIKFVEDLSWQQVLAKAQTEGRPIFLDCFATWCAPCKAMEKRVFSDEAVGAEFNRQFICVRVQMDATKQDGDLARQWRPDAKLLSEKYHIRSFPSFLFFAPSGQELHKAVGYKSVEQFLALGKEALEPRFQYYVQLARYSANKDYTNAANLAEQARKLDEKETAESLTRDYLENYLALKTEQDEFTKDDVDLVWAAVQKDHRNNLVGPSGKIFNTIYQKVLKGTMPSDAKSHASQYVYFVIELEEIIPKVWSESSGEIADWKNLDESPEWDKLRGLVAIKYGNDMADRVIMDSKTNWYLSKHEFGLFAKCVMDWAEKYGDDADDAYMNRLFFEGVFKHCSDALILQRAIRWDKAIVYDNPENVDYADTLANLLYKTGHVKEAIAIEEAAADRADVAAAKASIISNRKISADELYRKTVEKMKKGEPTWPS